MASPAPADFRALLQSAPDAYMVFTRDFDIVAATDAYLRATMTRREDVVGRNVFVVFPANPDDPEATAHRNTRASVARMLEKRAPDAMAIQKYNLRRSDGTLEERHWSIVHYPVLGPGGEVAWIIHRVEDVTAQIKKDAALVAHEQRFRLLVESVKDYAIFLLDPDGIVVSWNAGAERLLGYGEDEVKGKHFRLFYRDEDAKAGRPEAELSGALAQGRVEDEGLRVRKGGSSFVANVVVTAIKDGGVHRGFAKVVRDVTERREAEERIRELSTPVLRVRDRLLVSPVIGHFDSDRAAQLTDAILNAIRAHRARAIVLDLTGVATMDTMVANHLIQTIRSIRLLGARPIVTGVSSEIAATLVRLGIETSELGTVGDLEQGLALANEVLKKSN